jgi:hypothetical protein
MRQLRELAELCHLRIDEDKLPSLLKDVESIIQCTKTVQALTLGENIDDLYAKSDSDIGMKATVHGCVCCSQSNSRDVSQAWLHYARTWSPRATTPTRCWPTRRRSRAISSRCRRCCRTSWGVIGAAQIQPSMKISVQLDTRYPFLRLC